LKITDFGLSKLFQSGETMTYSFCGTPEYLAPEIVKGSGHNHTVDWWSLGIIIYEMLSGINPFKLRNKTNFDKLQMIMNTDVPMLPDFSQEAISLLKSLLTRNPSYRLGSGYDGIKEIKDHEFFRGVNWDEM
jgi:serine/threonine protein kinase